MELQGERGKKKPKGVTSKRSRDLEEREMEVVMEEKFKMKKK